MHRLKSADPLTSVAVLLILITLAVIAVSRLLYPYDAGCYEANIWAPASLLLNGANPYNLDYACQPPYVASTYGPAYYAIIGVGLKLFGLQLWFGRALSIAAAVAAALCLARIAALLTGSARLAVLAALAFCAQFPLQDWIAFQRPDMLALAFSLSGMLVAFRAERSQRIPLAQIALSATLVAAATLCRQTAVLPILVVGFVCARHFDRRALPTYAIIAGLLVITPHVLTNVTSHGGYLQQALLIPGSLPKNPQVAAKHLKALGQSPVTWLLFAVLLVALWRRLREHINPEWVARRAGEPSAVPPGLGVAQFSLPGMNAWATFGGPSGTPGTVTSDRLLSGRNGALPRSLLRTAKAAIQTNNGLVVCYFLGSAVLAVLTSSIPGSNVNYFLETCAAASLLVALAWPACEEAVRTLDLGGASGKPRPLSVPEGRRESSPAPSVLGEAVVISPVPEGRLTGAQGRTDVPQRWYQCLVIALAFGVLCDGARHGRGEYFRWQSLGYYHEIVSRLHQYSHQDEPCFSVYPELATSAGRSYYFNTETPYDGRSPQLAAVKARVFASGVLAAAVTHSPASPPGYHQVRLSHPVPTRIYPVFLHVR